MDTDLAVLVSHYRELTRQVEEARQAMHDAAVKRSRIAAMLNDRGIGYGKLAELMGVSKARMQQVVTSGR